MANFLPLIVGFGGYNAAGRSSGHQAYRRMVLDSLSTALREHTLGAIAQLMGQPSAAAQTVLDGTLVRRIEAGFFPPDNAPIGKNITLHASEQAPAKFIIAGKDLPSPLPEHWTATQLDDRGKRYQIFVDQDQTLTLACSAKMPVQSAGQLPTGFDPGAHYRSQHHPRGLQLAIMGASDAIHSVGIDWSGIASKVSPDAVAVYASSVMSQLDHTGLGGMMHARRLASRVTSKQLALGLNTMPADFINAYVLGSVGGTAGVTGACATFLYNLRQAVEDIRVGRTKVALVGSSEAPLIPEIMDGYAAMSALATDADLLKLDKLSADASPEYRRASRPFAENCGFTLAESAQFVVVMADDLALELGAQVFGAVPGVFVNADGFKKSISSPGAGNYITLAKAVAQARNLLGEDAVRNRSYLHAHGSSTPQNRVTESRIFHEVASAFGIHDWPVAAIKAYLGHSLGPASGDQLAACFGTFEHNLIPGIKTITRAADDVFDERLRISPADIEFEADIAFLNSKGFGGNNATATVLSPALVDRYLQKRYGSKQLSGYRRAKEQAEAQSRSYLQKADSGELSPIYEFGNKVIDESAIEITPSAIRLPGFEQPITLDADEGFTF